MSLQQNAIALLLIMLVLMPGVPAALLRPSVWRLPRRQGGLAPVVPATVSAAVLILLFLGVLALQALMVPGIVLGLHVYALMVPLFALAVLDARYYWLPDSITLPLLGLGLANAYLGGGLWAAASGALVWGAVPLALSSLHAVVRKVPGMGMGDVKLMAALGAWLGMEAGAVAVGAAALCALGYSALVWGFRLARQRGGIRVPFGSSLAIALWATALLHAGQGS